MSAAAVLARELRPGDFVWVEEGCGEPIALADALAEDAEVERGLVVVAGWTLRRPPYLDAPVSVRSLMGLGRWTGEAAAASYVPVRYGSVPALIASGALRVDAVLVTVGPPDREGRLPLGVQAGWLPAAVARARVVIAERNARLPDVPGFPRLNPERVVVACETDRELLTFTQGIDPSLARLARNAAALIPDGAALEHGPGSAVAAVLDALRREGRRFRLCSGMLTDESVHLHRSGEPAAATMLCGTKRLLRWAVETPELRGGTLDEVLDLADGSPFVALNGAVAVDLTGAADAEDIAAGVRGGIGGHADFSLAASRSAGGGSIVVLPARRADGGPAIVSAGRCTTPKTDVDAVVTEYGVARLRGATLAERAERLAAIAHPDDRAALLEPARR